MMSLREVDISAPLSGSVEERRVYGNFARRAFFDYSSSFVFYS